MTWRVILLRGSSGHVAAEANLEEEPDFFAYKNGDVFASDAYVTRAWR